MINPEHPKLSVTRQCELPSLNRSRYYYHPVGLSNLNKELMNRIDELYTEHPFLGYRKITAILNREGYKVNRKRVLRLMALMGLQAIYPRPKLSKPREGHKIYPYLLKGKTIDKPNQVWATDITYIRLQEGTCYLVAIMDWYSRYVVSWRVSSNMKVDFCLEALEDALEREKPEIFNTDQGSQFTSQEFTNILEVNEIAISMDGRGSYMDNIFTERLWRTVKYDEVYLKEYENIDQATQGIDKYLQFYNSFRPHQSLQYQTPESVYRKEKLESITIDSIVI